jgi:hypothetical protein
MIDDVDDDGCVGANDEATIVDQTKHGHRMTLADDVAKVPVLRHVLSCERDATTTVIRWVV